MVYNLVKFYFFMQRNKIVQKVRKVKKKKKKKKDFQTTNKRLCNFKFVNFLSFIFKI